MPGPDDGLGKKAEEKIKHWLDKPEMGYSFDRIPDQMSGYYGVSRNICDFICFKSPNLYYIESKEVAEDRFDFKNITTTQSSGLNEKTKISNCFGLIILLFSKYNRSFIFDIRDIRYLQYQGIKSINIKKIEKWLLDYVEISNIPSKKMIYDYDDNLEDLVTQLMVLRESSNIPYVELDFDTHSFNNVSKSNICKLELGGAF